MKSSQRPLKTIKKSLHPVGMLLVVCTCISCMVVIGCAQAQEVGGLQELTVEVLYPDGVRSVGSRAEVDPSEILMTAELYCPGSDGRLTRLRDERGESIEIMLVYDDACSCWQGTRAIFPCEGLVILAEDHEGDGGPSHYYGMTHLDFDGSRSALIEGRPVYSLGQEGPAGGYIYYEQAGTDYLSSGWRYLESAPNNWNDGVVPTAQWGYYGVETGTLFDGIGQGKVFTEQLCELDDTGVAATICDEATIGGKDDWFLPSGKELEALFNQLKTNSNGTPLEGLLETFYWSSVEVISPDESSEAKIVLFSTSEELAFRTYSRNSPRPCLPSRRF